MADTKKSEKKKKSFFEILSKFGQIAPTLTTLIAIVALWLGYINVERTLDTNKHMKAIEIYYNYTLRVEDLFNKGSDYLDTAFTFNSENWGNKNYSLFAHYVLFVCESLYDLEKESDAWRKTIYKYMLFPHVPMYQAKKSMDDAMLSDFRTFYNDSVLTYFRKNKNIKLN